MCEHKWGRGGVVVGLLDFRSRFEATVGCSLHCRAVSIDRPLLYNVSLHSGV